MRNNQFSMGRWTAGLGAASLAILAPIASVAADPPSLGTEREDHHHRPEGYQDLDLPRPPASAESPDYPLAAAFIPASTSNYTPNDIESYDYVVVHTMQGYYGGSISWFQNPEAQVSAHYLLRSEDGEVTQMVRHADKAWHVGNSNPYAIGLEHEGFIDDPTWYTYATYASSAKLARWLCEQLDIPVDRDHIVGHVELPGQTHTDPGDFWNWDLYMALITDVVPEGVIQGHVVDRSAACTLTATADTWIKPTLEGADALGEDDKCFVAAGESIEYVYAGVDMIGHQRLALVGDHPCATHPAIALDAFAFAEHFEGFCDPASLAVAAEVTVDGGASTSTAADGSFVISGLVEGEHTLDVSGAFETTSEVVYLDRFPGARVVIVVDPQGAGDDGGDDASDGDGEAGTGAGEGDGAGSDGGPDGPSDDPDDSDDGYEPGLPDTYGANGDEGGCGCRSGGSPGMLWFGILVVGALRRRREP